MPRASRFLLLIVVVLALTAGGFTAAGLSRGAAGSVDDPNGWRWAASGSVDDPNGWRWAASGSVDDPNGWRWAASDPTGWRWE